jgi:hypothetical protein
MAFKRIEIVSGGTLAGRVAVRKAMGSLAGIAGDPQKVRVYRSAIVPLIQGCADGLGVKINWEVFYAEQKRIEQKARKAGGRKAVFQLRRYGSVV